MWLRSRRASRVKRPKVPSLTRERRLRASRISERCGDESKKCGSISSIWEFAIFLMADSLHV